MQLNYEYKPVLVSKIDYIIHKGKQRDHIVLEHTHRPKVHEIIYVDYGAIKIDLADETIRLKPGESVIIPGGTPHSFRGEVGSPYDFLNILFRGKIPENILNKKINHHPKCHELIERLKDESIQKLPFSNEVMGACLTQLIAFLYRHSELSIPNALPDPAYQRNYKSAMVNRALAIIAQEYSSPLSLGKLAQSTGVSESYLRALLKKEVGKNFSEILHERRTNAAKHLLRESAYTLEDIAGAVGYKSLSFFFKIFKRQTGMTPMAYSRSLGDPEES